MEVHTKQTHWEFQELMKPFKGNQSLAYYKLFYFLIWIIYNQLEVLSVKVMELKNQVIYFALYGK